MWRRSSSWPGAPSSSCRWPSPGTIVAFTPLAARFLSDSNDRLALWAASFGMMLKHPIAGVGAGRTKRMFELYPDYAHTPFGDATDNARNTILLAGAEMGILAGIGSLLINIGLAGLAVLLIRDALRGDRRSTVLLAGCGGARIPSAGHGEQPVHRGRDRRLPRAPVRDLPRESDRTVRDGPRTRPAAHAGAGDVTAIDRPGETPAPSGS